MGRVELTKRFGVDGPEGETPSERKIDTIEWLREMMDDVSRDYYHEGACQGAKQLLRLQKEAKGQPTEVVKRIWRTNLMNAFDDL